MAETVPAAIVAAAPGSYGAPGPQLVIFELVIGRAWNLQGDPTSNAFMAAAEQVAGVGLPTRSNTAAREPSATALWLGPSSWLLIAGARSAPTRFESARNAMNTAGGALFDVTASRAAFEIDGARATDVLASGCPLDFHSRAFGADTCQQSVFGHIPALFYRRADAQSLTLLVARSFARDTWHALCTASEQYGYEVRAPALWVM